MGPHILARTSRASNPKATEPVAGIVGRVLVSMLALTVVSACLGPFNRHFSFLHLNKKSADARVLSPEIPCRQELETTCIYTVAYALLGIHTARPRKLTLTSCVRHLR